MSKKQLLEESTVRKFMKLANLEPLSDRFIKEDLGYTAEEEMPGEDPMAAGGDVAGGDEFPVDDAADMDDMEGGDDLEVELDDAGGDVSPEVAKKVIQAVMDALGVQGTVEDEEGMEDDSGMGDVDMDGGDEFEADDEEGEEVEDDAGADEETEDAGGEEEAEEELDETEELSEDELVENVLKRVTTRLISEARKYKKEGMDPKKKKNGIKEKMQAKKGARAKVEEKLDEEKHVKTHQKSSKVLTKGTNKHNVYKGTPDMEMKPLKGKGGKTGKGGHEMKPLKKSHNHIVTNDKNVNKLTSKGPNKA